MLDKTLHEVRGILDQMEGQIDTPVVELPVAAWVSPEPLSFEAREQGRYNEPKLGERWGELFDCAWFKLTIPEGIEADVLRFDCDGEALLVDVNGNPLRGLTSVTTRNDWPLGMWGKRFIPLELIEGQEVWIDAACNDLEGQDRGGTLRECHLARRDESLRDLYYDLFVLHSYAEGLRDFGIRTKEDELFLEQFQTILKGDLKANVRSLQAVLEAMPDSAYLVQALGHGHLDLLFLWPPRETWRKHVRTTSTVLDMMQRYPAYHYTQSQAQLYAWTRELAPGLWQSIKDRFEEGRWFTPAALWVESDVNLPDGESLIRQALYGQRFMQQNFGETSDLLFLPDAFGYPATVPLIMNHCGIKHFLTQKLSQNLVHEFPYHLFRWQGKGGSELISHFLPEDTYSSQAVPWVQAKAERRFKQRDLSPRWIELFGVGDGGGGPGPEHLERLKRQAKLGSAPKVTPGNLDDVFIDEPRLPQYVGELTFEKHHGTYTTVLSSKQNDRRLTERLRAAETYQVLGQLEAIGELTGQRLVSGTDRQVSRRPDGQIDLTPLWEEVLLMQFHDAITGTSIDRVYDECEEASEQMLMALATLETTSKEDAVFNPLPFERAGWVDGSYVESSGLGFCVYKAKTSPQETTIDGLSLTNEFLSATFTPEGHLSEIRRRDGEALHGSWGHFKLYGDEGDAWDINKSYHWDPVFEPEKMYWHQTPKSVESVSIQEVDEGLEFSGKIGHSSIRWTYRLRAGEKILNLELEIDYRDENSLLRLEGHLDYGATLQAARCGIPMGEQIRGFQGSQDSIFFAHPVQDYVAVEPGSEGLAFLIDDIHGVSLRDREVSFNVLRAVSSPSVQRDLGQQKLRIGLYPYAKKDAATVREQAQIQRYPLERVQAEPGGTWLLDGPLELTACKLAEADERVILRVLNPSTKDVSGRLRVPGLVDGHICDGLERIQAPLEKDGDAWIINLSAENIMTISFKKEG